MSQNNGNQILQKAWPVYDLSVLREESVIRIRIINHSYGLYMNHPEDLDIIVIVLVSLALAFYLEANGGSAAIF